MNASQNNTKPQWGPLVAALVFVEALAIVGAIALLYDRPTVSELEKRNLATFPELSAEAFFSGQYAQNLSLFFADTFPAREWLVRLAATVRESAGLRFDDIRLHEGTTDDTQPPQEPQAPALPVQPSLTPQSEAPSMAEESSEVPAVEEGVRMGAIFSYQGRGYQIFGGTDAMGQRYANTINLYQQAVGDHIKVYNLVIPSAIEFGLPERYKSITAPELPKLENIYNKLDPAISAVNVYDAFSAHRDEYLYFGTDHHWTSLGAYWAYTEFAKAAGFDPVSLDSLEKRTLNGFLGTLYAQTQDSKMAENPDHVDYYIMPTPCRCYLYLKGSPYWPMETSLYGEYAKPINSYSVFLQGDYPLLRIETDLNNGRRIAVVKESFGNAFVPYLVNHYEQILVVDQRYLQVGLLDLLKENRTNELLFINNIFAAYTPVRINELQRIMNQVYVPPAPKEEQSSSSQEPEQQPQQQGGLQPGEEDKDG